MTWKKRLLNILLKEQNMSCMQKYLKHFFCVKQYTNVKKIRIRKLKKCFHKLQDALTFKSYSGYLFGIRLIKKNDEN